MTTKTDREALDRLERLRAEHAANVAELEARAGELRDLEAELAEQTRRAQLEQAVEVHSAELESALAEYDDAAPLADREVTRLEELISEVASQFRVAVDAELRRAAAGDRIRTAAEQLAQHGVDAPLPKIKANRLHAADAGTALNGAQIICFANDPGIEADLARLAGKAYQPRDQRTIGATFEAIPPGARNPQRDPTRHLSPWSA